MDAEQHLELFRRGADALLTAATGSLGRHVPTCPEWDVGDLVIHAGTSWAWLADVVRSGELGGRSSGPDRTSSDDALLGWARSEADRFLETCEAADPDSPCWTIGLPHVRRFWFRRQSLEVTIHAYDAQMAIGEPAPFDFEVAADGVDEFLNVMIPRWIDRNPGVWNGETVQLAQTDGVGEWVVRLGPGESFDVQRRHGESDVTVRGPAATLWLWCWNRAPITSPDLEVSGDADIAVRWTSTISF